MPLREWWAHQQQIKSAYPAEWASCERYPETYAKAWETANIQYDLGNFDVAATCLVFAAVYEAQKGGKTSTPIELLVWAFFIRSAAIRKRAEDLQPMLVG